MSARARRRYEPPDGIDLVGTLRPLTFGGSLSMRFSADGVFRAGRNPEGVFTIRLVHHGDRIEAEGWGPGAAFALDGVPALLGFSDDPESFRPGPGPVAEIQRRFPGMRFTRTGAMVEALTIWILGQKVTGKESKASYRRLVRRYGEPAPGPEPLLVPPAAEVLAALAYYDYHPLGIEKKRADIIRRVAGAAGRMEEAAAMAPDRARERITAVPGVGPWTAANVLQVTHGDADAVAVGDYNLPHLVSWNLAGEPRGDDDRMLELLEPYRGHRARTARLLKAGGSTPPRYGPRLPVRRIERM